MKAIAATLLVLACAGAHAAATVTATPGPWDLYSGTSKVGTFPSNVACIEAARLRAAGQGILGSFTYSCKTATKVVATVVADPPPPVEPVAINTQPVGIAVIEGAPILLAVGATGGGLLAYQWYKDGAPVGLGGGLIPAGPTYGLTHALLTDAGTYTVVVRNSVGSVTSAPAIVAVTAKPPPPPPPGGSATLEWTPPLWKANGIDPSDVAGYLIRYGQESGKYAASMPAPGSPATVAGLAVGTWYFAIFTLDSAGNESPASYEISKTINP